MEMQFKNEIKKLADVVVWADNWIKELKEDLTEEEFAEDEEVKEFETVKKVVFEAMNRHIVYTNTLKNDIAMMDAKIEKLEKEIEGRKECYTALKELMDTKYISIEEHNNSVDPLNKEIERLNRYNKNLETANHNLVTRVALLEPEIDNLKKSFNALKEEMATRYITIETHNSICETYDNKIAELEKELADRNVKIRHQKENLDGINKTLEIRTKENESLIKVRNNLNKEIEAHESENARLTEKIMHWKNQERIRTDQLRATESKVEELWKEIEKFTKGEDKDHGRAGFEAYIRYIISEEEGKFKAELNRKFSEEVSKISQKRTEEELAKVKLNEIKGNGRTSSGRYPWGAKVNDIPCGEDAIE